MFHENRVGRTEAPRQSCLDFADLNETFFDSALVLPSHQNRWLGIGKNMHGVIVVVFVALGKEAVSLISMRPASKNERKLYAKS